MTKDTIDQDYISQLEERERQLNLILELKEKNSTYVELKDVVDNMTRAAMDYFAADGCNYNIIQGDKISVNHSLYNKMPMPEGTYKLSQYPKLRSLLKEGKVFFIEDMNNTDQFDENLKASLIKNGIISCLVAPIQKNGDIVGFFAITQTTPRKWTDSQKELIKKLSLLAWGATEIIEKEKEKDRLIDQLREKEEWVSAIIDSMDANVWVINSLGETTVIGGKDKGIFKSQFHGKSIQNLYRHLDFYSLDGIQVKLENIDLNEYISGQTRVSEGIIHNKNTDELLYRQCRSSPIKNKDGEIKGTVVISFDIEEKIMMEEALKESNKHSLKLIEELRIADELRKRFLSTLSHELRNPLATIALGLDLMDYKEEDLEEQRKTRGILKRQTQQLIRLVDDLLNMTRFTQNKFELNLEEVEVNKLLEEIIMDNYLNFNEKGIKLEGIISPEKIIIEGDKSRLRQVIENILGNSLKFTPEEGKVIITLKRDKTSKGILISIKDTGKGIPPDILENIFDPYVQAENYEEKSLRGLGIGLSIVKDIVERHKGTIKAYSQGENMGTEMVIRLPTI